MQAASAIVVRNKLPGEGLDAEIALLCRLGRLGDTYFTHPIDAAKLGGSTPQTLQADTLEQLRKLAARPHAPLTDQPLPTCLWIQGKRRQRVANNVFLILDMLNSFADCRQPMPRDIQGRLLFWATAASLGLERLDLLIITLSAYVNIVSMYRPDELQDAGSILRNYSAVLTAVARAIATDPGAAAVLEVRNFERLRGLMGEDENATALLRSNLDVIAEMPMRLAQGR